MITEKRQPLGTPNRWSCSSLDYFHVLFPGTNTTKRYAQTSPAYPRKSTQFLMYFYLLASYISLARKKNFRMVTISGEYE